MLYPVELRAQFNRRSCPCRNPGRGRRIRTADPLLPKQMRYQTAPCPDASISVPRHRAGARFCGGTMIRAPDWSGKALSKPEPRHGRVLQALVSCRLQNSEQPWRDNEKHRYFAASHIDLDLCPGGGQGAGSQHSQSLYSWFAHVPGIKVALPATSMEAKGLMKSAIRDDNPVLFFEHKSLYRTRWPVTEEYKDPEFLIPFGQSITRREGADITVVATLVMAYYALEAAKELAEENISVEVIDPRTLVPLDKEAIIKSVRKTGRLMVVDEAYLACGIHSEIITLVSENALHDLKTPPRRIGNPGVPVPFEPSLEDIVLPTKEKIVAAAREMMKA